MRPRIQAIAIGYKVDYSDVQFKLAEGFSPKLGLLFNNIQIVPLENCKGNIGLKSGFVYLPVNIFALIFGKVATTDVQISSLVFRQYNDNCESSDSSLSVGVKTDGADKSLLDLRLQKPNSAQIQKHFTEVSTFLAEAFNKTADEISEFVDGVNVLDGMILVGEKPYAYKFKSLNASFNNSDDNKKIKFKADLLNPGEKLGVEIQPFKIQGEIFVDKVSMNISSKYREGRVELSSVFDIKEQSFLNKLQFKAFPIQELKRVVAGARVLQSSPETLNSWINCTVNFDGKFIAIEQSNYELSECSLYGDVGQIHVVKGSLSFVTPGQINALELGLKDLSVEKALILFNRVPIKGLLPSHGIISGQVKISSEGKTSIESVVSNVHFSFVEGLSREEFKISSARLNADFDGNRWSLKVMDAQLTEGKFVGEITLNISKDFSDGLFQVNLPEVRFSRGIYGLYGINSDAMIEFYGRGIITAREVSHWSGVLGAKEFAGDAFKISNLKIKGDFAVNSGFRGTLTLDEYDFLNDNRFFNDVKAMLLVGNADNSNAIKLRDINLQFKVESDAVSLLKAKARSSNVTAGLIGAFTADGLYSRDKRKGHGTIIVDIDSVRDAHWHVEINRGAADIWPAENLVDRFIEDQQVVRKTDEEFKQYSMRWKDRLLKEPSPLKLIRSKK